MSEESKQGAPGGASPVCEICGREGFACGRNMVPYYALQWPPDQAAIAKCYQIAYERLRASLSTAEKALAKREREIQFVTAEHDKAWVLLGKENDKARAAEKETQALVSVVRDALYYEGYCEQTTNGVLLKPAHHGNGCDSWPPHICDCWVMRGFAAQARDAPTAPKESEIASDSSALEKALGALRAARPMIEAYRRRLLSEGPYIGDPEPDVDGLPEALTRASRIAQASQTLRDADAALSGGAHVDALKAQKEEVK